MKEIFAKLSVVIITLTILYGNNKLTYSNPKIGLLDILWLECLKCKPLIVKLRCTNGQAIILVNRYIGKLMKIWNSLLIASTIFLASTNTFAAESKGTDYYPDYYENEGDLLFKVRGFYAATSGKASGLPAPTNPGANGAPGSLIQNGLGFDTATSFFFTNNFAVELSLGLIYYNIKGATLDAIFTNYGTGTNNNKKKKNIYSVPASATLQYHIAPYGAIRPYVGGGFHGTYMSTQSKQFKIRNAYGAVVQAGVDFVGRDDTIINFDVRQFFLESRIKYKSTFLNTQNTTGDVSSKLKLNPILISVGVGFKF